MDELLKFGCINAAHHSDHLDELRQLKDLLLLYFRIGQRARTPPRSAIAVFQPPEGCLTASVAVKCVCVWVCVYRHRFHPSTQAFEDKFTPVRVYQHHIFCLPNSSEQIIGAAAPWNIECSKAANPWEHTCSCRSLTYRCLISKGSTLFLSVPSPRLMAATLPARSTAGPLKYLRLAQSALQSWIWPPSRAFGAFQLVKGAVPELLELQSLQQLAGDWCSRLSAAEV